MASSSASRITVQLAKEPSINRREPDKRSNRSTNDGKSTRKSTSPSAARDRMRFNGLATPRSFTPRSFWSSAAPPCSCKPPPSAGWRPSERSKTETFSMPANLRNDNAAASPAGPAPMTATRSSARRLMDESFFAYHRCHLRRAAARPHVATQPGAARLAPSPCRFRWLRTTASPRGGPPQRARKGVRICTSNAAGEWRAICGVA
mmetsp:Transcript_110967/g.312854  ORF Transcript_110967/g.312854 Transcript_110967/m.312854 type:complete len:205 (+) Transcript_110967:959-1573(+)